MTFTIKWDKGVGHIAGLTTRTGRAVHAIPRTAETGQSYGDLQDAVSAIENTSRSFCRVCRIASELILNRR